MDGRCFLGASSVSGTWVCGESSPGHYDMNELFGYAAWTDDGKTRHSPIMLEGMTGLRAS